MPTWDYGAAPDCRVPEVRAATLGTFPYDEVVARLKAEVDASIQGE